MSGEAVDLKGKGKTTKTEHDEAFAATGFSGADTDFRADDQIDPMSLPPVGENIEDDSEDSDIYRGERPPSPPHSAPARDADVLSSVGSSSSSSSSLNVGRRLGAFAAVVELAISRWARKHSSASSTSSGSSSTSSISSNAQTLAASRRRRRRNSSTHSLKSVEHERAILARKKAREELRVAPREFTLLLPPHLAQGPVETHKPGDKSELQTQVQEQRVLHTTSMQHVRTQLESALKKTARLQRAQGRAAASPSSMTPAHRSVTPTNTGKGNGKKPVALPGEDVPSSSKIRIVSDRNRRIKQGWWLDVSSPTWNDMRSLGQILRLHPLTLEDILHQEPREKLELFPRLGYYFIIFRALEGERTRERFRKLRSSEGDGLSAGSQNDTFGGVNVYLVVFKEGICTFHFDDISEHTEKLRSKVLHLEGSINMSSDWIAHGILDSVVDTFFPVLTVIEKEVKALDALVAGAAPTDEEGQDTLDSAKKLSTGGKDITNAEKNYENDVALEEKEILPLKQERPTFPSSDRKISFLVSAAPHPAVRSMRRLTRFARTFGRLFRSKSTSKDRDQAPPPTHQTLHRMATTRRLVTSLTRLLGTKNDVVAQIRKRLLASSSMGLWNSSKGLSDDEVVIYLGDVQDHILTLQQLLNDYERMLSQSHPAYLSQLRVSQTFARGNTDNAILYLTVVSMMVLCVQGFLGIFSINVQKIPSNRKSEPGGPPGGPLIVFFVILAGSVLIGCGLLLLVHHWRRDAKRRFSRKF